MQERDAKRREEIDEEQLRRMRERASDEVAMANQIGEAMGAQLSAFFAGQATAEEAFKAMSISAAEAILDMVQRAVMAYAVEAAATAYAANQGVPVVGPVIGAAAAAVAFGFVRGYLGQLKGMAAGGIVEGGVPGRDSVPALLMPGELVVPAALTRQLLALAGASGSGSSSSGTRMANGGIVPASASRGVTQVNMSLHMMVAPDRLNQKRLLRSMDKQLRSHLDRG
jgi:hypothetical protein